MSLINLTPHPIRVYGGPIPDQINPDDYEPILVIEPDPDLPPARIGTIELGTQHEGLGIPVEYVEYTAHGGLVHSLPKRQDGVWYVVSLVVAMQQTYVYGRPDLLVPYLEVRNMDGTMIGCKMLARPV